MTRPATHPSARPTPGGVGRPSRPHDARTASPLAARATSCARGWAGDS